jgi:alginate O-acetyltransferase complex protein AlgI
VLFNSFEFLVFFPTVTGLFFILPHRFRWLLLLLASCYFYMFFKPIYILILFSTIIIDYFAGLLIHKTQDQKQKKYFLILSLCANIGILAFFKYFNFLNMNLSHVLEVFSFRNPIPFLEILLPIGLSFHTFQAMSYTIEVYRGNQQPETHFGIYALYVMFYPQLVAGPIERPQNVLHQFHEEKFFEYHRVVSGLRLMLWGFFKKMVIADNIGVYADAVFNHPNDQNSATFLIGAMCFCIQIYCDFSGYSDIALGSARVMGYDLMRNFNVPYISKNIKEFWTRWHISLSSWFRDYLYIPLGGNRKGERRKYMNVFIVFLLSGLWHGASWNFVVWGGLHGTFVLLSDVKFGKRQKPVPEENSAFVDMFKVLFTFFLVTLIWIYFRVTDVSLATHAVKTIFTGWGDFFNGIQNGQPVFHGLGIEDKKFFMGLVAIIIIFYIVDKVKDNLKIRDLFYKTPVVRYALYFTLTFMILVFSYVKEVAFIYFQF